MSSSDSWMYSAWGDLGELYGKVTIRSGNMREIEYWYKSGSRESREFYNNGRREGVFRFWGQNGRPVKQVFYKDDKLDGECKQWNSNGRLSYEFYLKDKCIDSKFTAKKKLIFLHLKRKYHSRFISGTFMNIFLIDDLARVILE